MQLRDVYYKQTESANLKFKMFTPDSSSEGLLPAVIFFFGGGWRRGTIDRFAPQCEEIVKHGIIGITPEYRLFDESKGINGADSNIDGCDAVDYVFAHAEELGIDSSKIVVAGGSAGGQIAAYIGLSRAKRNQPNQPAAMALFNPVMELKGLGEKHQGVFADKTEEYSPVNFLCEGAPPTVIFHGECDELIPYESIVEIGEQMRSMGNICEVHIYPGMDHAFFGYGNYDNVPYTDTTAKMIDFLNRLGMGK